MILFFLKCFYLAFILSVILGMSLILCYTKYKIWKIRLRFPEGRGGLDYFLKSNAVHSVLKQNVPLFWEEALLGSLCASLWWPEVVLSKLMFILDHRSEMWQIGYCVSFFPTDSDPVWLSWDLRLYQIAHSRNWFFFTLEWDPSYFSFIARLGNKWPNLLLPHARWIPVLNIFSYKVEDLVIFPETLCGFFYFRQIYENVCPKPSMEGL